MGIFFLLFLFVNFYRNYILHDPSVHLEFAAFSDLVVVHDPKFFVIVDFALEMNLRFYVMNFRLLKTITIPGYLNEFQCRILNIGKIQIQHHINSSHWNKLKIDFKLTIDFLSSVQFLPGNISLGRYIGPW